MIPKKKAAAKKTATKKKVAKKATAKKVEKAEVLEVKKYMLHIYARRIQEGVSDVPAIPIPGMDVPVAQVVLSLIHI